MLIDEHVLRINVWLIWLWYAQGKFSSCNLTGEEGLKTTDNESTVVENLFSKNSIIIDCHNKQNTLNVNHNVQSKLRYFPALTRSSLSIICFSAKVYLKVLNRCIWCIIFFVCFAFFSMQSYHQSKTINKSGVWGLRRRRIRQSRNSFKQHHFTLTAQCPAWPVICKNM